MLALLLEAVQDKYSFVELHGINRAVGTAGIVFNNLKHSGAAKALEHLRGIVLITGLSKGKCVTEESPYVRRQCHQVFVAAGYPFERRFVVAHCLIIPEQVYRASVLPGQQWEVICRKRSRSGPASFLKNLCRQASSSAVPSIAAKSSL